MGCQVGRLCPGGPRRCGESLPAAAPWLELRHAVPAEELGVPGRKETGSVEAASILHGEEPSIFGFGLEETEVQRGLGA